MVHVGCHEEAATRLVGARGWRQPERLLGELGGCGRRATRRRCLGCLLDEQGDGVVGTRRGEREVTSPLLSGRGQVREPRVQRPTARRGLPCNDRRSQQRMRHPHAFTVELENPSGKPLGQAFLETGTDRLFHDGHGRIRERRDSLRNSDGRCPERVDALVQQLFQSRRDRQLCAGRERAASAPERRRQLEREERVAARGLPEPDQRRSRKRDVETAP